MNYYEIQQIRDWKTKVMAKIHIILPDFLKYHTEKTRHATYLQKQSLGIPGFDRQLIFKLDQH